MTDILMDFPCSNQPVVRARARYAAAVKYSIDRVENLNENPSWLISEYVDNIEIVDILTVKFVLKKAGSYFPALVATPPYFPVSPKFYPEDEAAEPTEGHYGPYKIKSWTRDIELVLEANPDYHGVHPKSKYITIKFFPNATTMRQALEDGETDIAWRTLQPTDIADLKENPAFNVFEAPESLVRSIMLRCNMTPFDDVHLRRAVAASINRTRICMEGYMETVEPLYSMVPKKLWSHIEVFKEEYGVRNLTLARELLTAAGYNETNKFEFDLWVAAHYIDPGTVIKSDLEETGMMNVTLKTEEWPTYVANIPTGIMPIFLLGWAPDFLDPDGYLRSILHSGYSADYGVFYNNTVLDTILDDAIVELNITRRTELYEDAQRLSAEDAPVIPFAQGTLYAVAKPNIKGIHLSPTLFLPYYTIYMRTPYESRMTQVVSTESNLASWSPSLTVDLAGNVHVAWHDDTDYADCGNDSDIFYRRCEAGGEWTSIEVISTESTVNSYFPSLAVDLAGNVHVAWHDDTDYADCGNDWDIFYKYVCVHSTQYPWSMFRHNLRNTGYTESPAPNTNQTMWNYTTGNCVTSSAAVVDGKVYVGSEDDNVYCLDASTGTKIWNYTTGGSVDSSPAVVDGRVFAGSSGGNVYCLDASTGDYIWSYTTDDRVHSSPAVADGVVFVGSFDHMLYAFGNIIRVPEDYLTVQEAIDAADPGATIIVAPGIYYENLVINKTVAIVGQPGSAPIFDGGGSGIAVTLLSGASGSIIAGIVITNYDQGILMVDSSDSKIYDNTMSLMEYSGVALYGSSAVNNFIYSNIFQDNTVAIELVESSTSNTIYKNIITLNDVGLNLESSGNIIYANTIVENEVGINMSNVNNNIIYHNNFINNIENAVSEELSNIWDNGYPSGGNYWSTHISEDVCSGPGQDELGCDGIVDTEYTIAVNNIDRYPLVEPFNQHDIGITNLFKSKTVVGQGYTLSIELKILNYGMYDETFTVTVCANAIPISTQAITLTKRNYTTITFTWNTAGWAKGNYTITAYVPQIPDEIDIADNSFTDGWVIVAMVGDITGPENPPGSGQKPPDGECDMRDVGLVARYFGEDVPPAPANCDLTGPTTGVPDGTVDMRDVGLVARQFGETDP